MTVSVAGGNGLRLAVDIDSGARITSLTTADGREWLAPSQPTTQASATPSFSHSGMGGWDDVAPTIQSDVLVDGARLRDHGDVWNVPWTELESAPGHLHLMAAMPSIHATLYRSIKATNTGFRIDWRATTTARLAVPMLWAAHPQFRSTPESSISFFSVNRELIPMLVESYPVPGRLVRFDNRPFEEWAIAGASLKAFITSEQRVDAVSITGQGESSMTLRWDPVKIPFLGLFWDNREFGKEPVFSVEPTTGFGDLASTAIKDNRVALLTAREPLDWWVDISTSRYFDLN